MKIDSPVHVYRQSKRDYENEQKKLKRQETKEKVAMEKTIEISKHEVVQLQEQKKTEQEKMNAVGVNSKSFNTCTRNCENRCYEMFRLLAKFPVNRKEMKNSFFIICTQVLS